MRGIRQWSAAGTALAAALAAWAFVPAPQSREVTLSPRDCGGAGADCSALLTRVLNDPAYTTVRLAAGEYPLDRSVPIRRSNLRLVGQAGAYPTLRQRRGGWHMLAASQPRGFLTGLTVDSLRFVGARLPHEWGFAALGAASVRNLRFRWNRAEGINLVIATTRTNTYAAAAPDSLNAGIEVTGNRGTGPAYGKHGAIYVKFARDVAVTGNTVRGYSNGIVLWGGDGRAEGRRADAPRKASGILVEGNDVRQSSLWTSPSRNEGTGTGIFLAMARDAVVRRNTVFDCHDICLDAEASHDVRFEGNTAGYSKNGGVLAVYLLSRNVTFTGNDVVAEGGTRDNGILFAQSNEAGAEGVTVTLAGNTFRYTGRGGMGRIEKSQSHLFRFERNVLENTVLRLASNNGGAVSVTRNRLAFTLPTGDRPAIEAGDNYLPQGWPAPAVNAAGHEMEIAGNTITSRAPQRAQGIRVLQEGGNERIDTSVTGNEIRGFAVPVAVARAHPRHTVVIEGNRHTGTLPAAAAGVQVRNNTRLGS